MLFENIGIDRERHSPAAAGFSSFCPRATTSDSAHLLSTISRRLSNRHLAIRNRRNSLKTNDECTL
jgi:hypothetical protein